jgi:histone H2A
MNEARRVFFLTDVQEDLLQIDGQIYFEIALSSDKEEIKNEDVESSGISDDDDERSFTSLKVKGKAKSRSSRARLQFPVGRIRRLLRKGNYAERFGAGAPVYLAAVMEYLAASRFLSWPAMLPVTTTRPGSSPVTCNWPSVMTMT